MRTSSRALAAILFLASGCAGGTEPAARPSPQQTAAPVEDELPADCEDAAGPRTVSITAVDNEFEPFCVTVSADQRFEVTNEGISRHTFTIRETEIDLRLRPGATASTGPIGDSIEPGSGEQEFFCTLHPSMVGYFAVE
jgi:plastocyanin